MTREELIRKINELPSKQRQVLLAMWRSMLDQLFGSVVSSKLERADTASLPEAFLNLSPYKIILRGLTHEDLEILRLMVEGLSENEIADQLGLDPDLVRWRLAKVRASIRARARWSHERTGNRTREEGLDRRAELAENERASLGHGHIHPESQKRLSQRLYGVLTFDGEPPNDEELRDLISDYLIEKYS